MSNPLIDEHNRQLEESLRILEQHDELLGNISRKKKSINSSMSNELPNFMLNRR